MPILKITVENAKELLNASYLGAGGLGRVERSAVGGGAGYAEISTFALVDGTRIYTVYDLAGTASSWYRVRYSKADGSSPSSYGDEFQTGAEEGGLICSLYDVKQRLNIGDADASKDEMLLEFIGQVGDAIMHRCGRRFVRTPSSGTSTFYFQGPRVAGRSLFVPEGVAELTSLEVATTSQPATGGTYTVVPAAEVLLRPTEVERGYGYPATEIVISDLSSSQFWPGYNTIRWVGAKGFARVPREIAGIAEDAVILKYTGRGQGYTASPVEGGWPLRGISREAAETLDSYRIPSIG